MSLIDDIIKAYNKNRQDDNEYGKIVVDFKIYDENNNRLGIYWKVYKNNGKQYIDLIIGHPNNQKGILATHQSTGNDWDDVIWITEICTNWLLDSVDRSVKDVIQSNDLRDKVKNTPAGKRKIGRRLINLLGD